ncbi:hypothetical protein N7471_009519 [Penicillium samsonianum]|uniref:uncharacterized protein n=1 Tax=Penicillium samsonianum TaxID=1882272 RepID=UPI002546FBC9|nr:uncharacterized protein N7471_009519 [Penicillium samsonianum]KAJ6128302.1 hypothetical protein N7471_009519 [Penicillium samsonianum]
MLLSGCSQLARSGEWGGHVHTAYVYDHQLRHFIAREILGINCTSISHHYTFLFSAYFSWFSSERLHSRGHTKTKGHGSIK